MNDDRNHRKRRTMSESQHPNDGPPCQAMKRMCINRKQPAARAEQPWFHPLPEQQQQRQEEETDYRAHQQQQQQHAGQATMSEGFGTPSPRSPTKGTTTNAAAAAAEPNEDTDYHAMNRILGDLHLERERREQRRQQQQQQQPRGGASDEHEQQASSQSNSSTPPRRPKHLPMKHLHTTTKLG